MVILSLPESDTVAVGATSAEFSVTATGDNLMFLWSLGGQALDATNTAKYSGVMSDTLTIMNIVEADAGSYTVVVSNGAGSVTAPDTSAVPPEEAATLTVCTL